MNLILERIGQILSSPIKDPSMFWEIIPIIITIFIIELYFGKYKEEELGWNSALSNSLALIYVGTNLLHYLYLQNRIHFGSADTIVSLGVLLIGLVTAVLDFNHILPKRITFGISSVMPIYFLSFIAIIFVHEQLILDMITVWASGIMFLCLIVFITLIQSFERLSL